MSWIEKVLCKLFPGKVDILKDENGQTVLQLRRWFIIGHDDSDDPLESRRPRLCLHKLARGDSDRYCHTHPWPWWTFVLWGSYIDESYKWNPSQNGELFRSGPFYEDMHTGKFAIRGEDHLHQVKLKNNKPCWTLVWMGRPTKPWGFVNPEGKWIHKNEYLYGKEDGMI